MKKILFLVGICLLSSNLYAGFNFCQDSSGNGGSGSFEQKILNQGVVEVGILPSGIEGIHIELKSTNDIDIQLFDKQSGQKIVHWPDGILNGSDKQSTSYDGINIEWSGYNGVGEHYGNEYIKINGKTNRPFVMKVYGYRAGDAKVNYSWTGGSASGCSIPSSGSGTFNQQILTDAIVTVGDIPPGVNNLYIKLTSNKDVDIQLHDKDDGTKIVVWKSGILNGPDKQSTTYQNMKIEWSGYNGDGYNLGHEYIKITGKTTRNLTMKAYGYKAGYATVDYSWGNNEDNNLQAKYPKTKIKKDLKSVYAKKKNAFYETSYGQNLVGQCTWYVYGRVIELADKGYFSKSVKDNMYNAFWGKYGRDAKNWPDKLDGNWYATTVNPLPVNKRKPGLLAVWSAGNYGHVGFVEEVSEDKTKYRLSDFNRGDNTKYKDKWYNFVGESDKLLNTYPKFYDLSNPNW